MFFLLGKPFGFALLIFGSMILKEIICHDNLLLELAVYAAHFNRIWIILTANELSA